MVAEQRSHGASALLFKQLTKKDLENKRLGSAKSSTLKK
jgi:hypothetical protein